MKNVLFVLSMLLAYAHCIRFYLEPNSMKCLKEESQADVLVNGEYSMTVAPAVKIEFIVRDSKGHILSRKEDIPHGKLMKFSFVTETYDTYEICFISQVVQQSGISDGHGQGSSMRPEIYLISKRGIEAKSYEGIGEASKLKPVEVELKRLEDLSEVIVQDFARMRKNEEELRDTNEAISSRVLYFSMFSMCCMLLLSTSQVIYLKIFFKAKKLID